MRGVMLFIALLCLTTSCHAAPFFNSQRDAPTNVVRLPLRRRITSITDTRSRRRDLPVSLGNTKLSYLVDLELGTPSQSVTLTIDTGSSEVWAFAPEGCDNCEGGSCKLSRLLSLNTADPN